MTVITAIHCKTKSLPGVNLLDLMIGPFHRSVLGSAFSVLRSSFSVFRSAFFVLRSSVMSAFYHA